MPKKGHRTASEADWIFRCPFANQVHQFSFTHIHTDVLENDMCAVPDGHVIEPNEWSVSHQR